MSTVVHRLRLPGLQAGLLRWLPLGLGIAFLGYLLERFGKAEVWKGLGSMGWRLVPLLALELAGHALNARGWWYTLPRRTRSGCFGRLLLVRLAGSALNQTTPGRRWAVNRSRSCS